MMLSNPIVEFIKKEMGRYEDKRSAIIPCLFRIQKEHDGWLNDDCIRALSHQMDLPEKDINEVFHFYTMFNKKPVGKFHVQVCGNISCFMKGSQKIIDHLCKEFDVKKDELSRDKMITVSKVECLGACDGAPMCQINKDYYENLTEQNVASTIKNLIAQKKSE